MAYFKKLKLDSNFENWLDSKILKLKAEGLLESDPEDCESEGEVELLEKHGQEQEELDGVVLFPPPPPQHSNYIPIGGLVGSDSEQEWGEEWEQQEEQEEQEEQGEQEEYVWGEDAFPIVEPEADVRAPTLLTVAAEGEYYAMSAVSGAKDSGGMENKEQKEEEEEGEGEDCGKGRSEGGGFSYSKHISSELGGDYYQLTWEEDEEADVFDREEYQLGHGIEHIPPVEVCYSQAGGGAIGSTSGDSEPQRQQPRVWLATTTSNDLAVAHQSPQTAYCTDSEAMYRLADSASTTKPVRAGSLAGIVLGVGSGDVEVTNNKGKRGMQRKGVVYCNNGSEHRHGHGDESATSLPPHGQNSQFQVHDTDDRPDPRFSIAEENDTTSDMSMLELARGGRRREKNHPRFGRSAADPVLGTTVSFQSLPPEGAGADGAERSVQDYTTDGSTYGTDCILLPMDSMEMTMTSEDDDDDVIVGDGAVSSDTAPIVTVNQATLIQQWRSKSLNTRYGMVAALVAGLLLLFSLMVYFMIRILTSS